MTDAQAHAIADAAFIARETERTKLESEHKAPGVHALRAIRAAATFAACRLDDALDAVARPAGAGPAAAAAAVTVVTEARRAAAAAPASAPATTTATPATKGAK